MSGDTVVGWGGANSLLWLSDVLAALQSPGERQEVWNCSLKVQSTSMSIGKDTTSFDFCLRFPLEYSSFLVVIPTMLNIHLLVYCFSQFICILIILLMQLWSAKRKEQDEDRRLKTITFITISHQSVRQRGVKRQNFIFPVLLRRSDDLMSSTIMVIFHKRDWYAAHPFNSVH